MPFQKKSIASFLKETKDALLRVEVNKLVMDPSQVQDYLSVFDSITVPESKAVQSFVKMYHKTSGDSFDIKMKIFDSNETKLFSETITTISIDKNVKLLASQIKSISNVPQSATYIHLTKRFTFGLLNRDDWALHIDLVKELNNPLEFATKLKPSKVSLVDTDLSEMQSSAFDYVTVSVVKTSDAPVSHLQIAELVADLTGVEESTHSNNEAYQAAIFNLAKDILKDPVQIAQFKRKSGFKRIVSNTIELSRPIFFKKVLPVIDTIYMTDKMDGVRAMLVIDEVYRRSGHRRIYLGADIYAISDKIYSVSTFQNPVKSSTIETDHTVLDVEMMENKFYCFDVIAFKSKRLSGLPFKERLSRFEEVAKLMDKYELGTTKEFIKLSQTTFGDQLKAFYEKKRSYHIDGIIFTPEGMFHREAVAQQKHKFDRIFNTNYANTISFKWKPLDQLTIDFYLMQVSKTAYALCSGIDMKTFKKLRLSFFNGYKPPPSPNAHQYFPIQFEPYDGNFDYMWTPTPEELKIIKEVPDFKSLDGMVGEFKFAENNKQLEKPELIRLRADREQDIAKGEYYGNNLKYAELIYHSIQYPLTIDDMCNGSGGYFGETSDWYKPQRSFNSFVKTYLMETYLHPKSETARIMDFACGHGQDLARSVDIGFDEIVMMDKDVDAIYDLLDRKYDLRIKRKEGSANVHIKRIDLEESSDKTIKDLRIAPESADSAMINFALHYICHSAGPGQNNPVEEFAKLVGYYLKPQGRLMITAFNGKSIFDLLEGKDEWSATENSKIKYSIKKAYSSNSLTLNDQSIEVLLPFSGGEYYREYLVNYEYVQSVFEANGFKMIAADTFEPLLRSYKAQNKKQYEYLSSIDKEYVSLYGYMIFEKN